MQSVLSGFGIMLLQAFFDLCFNALILSAAVLAWMWIADWIEEKRRKNLEDRAWVARRTRLIAEEFDYSIVRKETTDEGETAQ